MTCKECELMLADGRSAEADEHLTECVECRVLAQDLQANREALAAMREEFVPARAFVFRRRARWPWAIAAAAVLVIGFAVMRSSDPVGVKESPGKEVTVVTPSPKVAVTPVERSKVVSTPQKRSPRIPFVPPAKTEPMLVKMLTSDPDVVIYWLVEAGE